MPFIILTNRRWYIVLSILTVICVVNLILAIYVTLGSCDEFLRGCKDAQIMNYPLYWTINAIALITFVLLILLLYYLMKMRKIWAAQALKEKENMRLKVLNKQNRQRNGNDNRALQSNLQQTASVEIPISSNC
jgi:uncharacterized membrane protein